METVEGVVLVTGGAKRIGAAIVRELHHAGMQVVIHHRRSANEAAALAAALNHQRPNSAEHVEADLRSTSSLGGLVQQAHQRWGRLDALVNNASSYIRTPLDQLYEAAFDDLIATNLKAPLFLARACAPLFGSGGGSIVNIIDALADRARPGYVAYGAAKSALWTATQSLAAELAPKIRVNGVAPGHILWAEGQQMDDAAKQAAIAQVALGRLGTPDDIARTVRFLLSREAAYITGVILPVDGGLRVRS